jgi:membrane protease YdiL (CAAX protease family)
MPLGTKIVLILFVVTISILYGLLNRKFQSLLPSAILHSTNGLIQNLMSVVWD